MEAEQNSRGNRDNGTAQWRIRESQIFVLSRRFRDMMIKYNQEVVLYRDKCKDAIVRELELCK